MKFKQKLMLSFTVVLLLTLIVGMIGWFELTSINSAYKTLLDERVEKMLIAKDLGGTAADETKNVRGYLLTGNGEHFNSYLKNRQTFKEEMTQILAGVHTEKSKEIIAKMNDLETKYSAVVAEIVEYKKVEDIKMYTRLVEEKCVPMARQLAATSEELEQYQEAQLNEMVKQTSEKVSSIKTILVITGVIA